MESKVKLELSAYEARILLMHINCVTDAGAETLDYEELMALEQIIFKLNSEVFK